MSVNPQDTQYGYSPGVRTIVGPGGIASTQIGRAQKIVLFGRGDPSDGDASTNTPTQIQTVGDPASLFGRGSELAEEIEKALRNKGSREWLYGVMPDENTVQGEPLADGNTTENVPIIEDPDLINVTDISSGNSPVEQTVEFNFDDPPTAPGGSDTVVIKPQTGEFASGDDTDYEIDYAYLDWEAALDSADQVLNHSEVGVYAPLSDSVAVAELLDNKLTPEENAGLRREYKLAVGVVGAQPNTTTDDNEGAIAPEEYADPIDSKAIFMPGPVRREGTNGRTIIGGVAGIMAGNELQNPIYGDEIRGYSRLTQALTRDEQQALRDNQIIPVVDDYRDADDHGISLEGNLATTSITDDFEWSYQNRRVIDLIILAQHEIARSARDQLMTDSLLGEIESNITDVFDDFARAGLIRGNPDGQTTGTGASAGGIGSIGTGTGGGGDGNGNGNGGDGGGGDDQQSYFVDATRTDVGQISVASGFSPIPVLKDVVNEIRVTDTLDQLGTGGETTEQTG